MTNIQDEVIKLLLSTERKGIEDLIQWLFENEFFTSPASIEHHGAYKGGLAKHSYNVYLLLFFFTSLVDIAVLNQVVDIAVLNQVNAAGQRPLPLVQDNLIIAALLHDVCKAGAYIPTPEGKKLYKWNKGHPKGHAKLSIEILKRFIQLDPIEEMMIRYHMGVYGLNEFYKPDDWQQGEYPLRGDDEKSKEERYGNSLANAWYHNPVVKLMYFCDGLACYNELSKKLEDNQNDVRPPV